MILPLNPSRRYAAPSPNPLDLGRAGVGSHLGEVPKAEGAQIPAKAGAGKLHN